ncbi:MAG: hypothetical protein HOP08_08430 [Cyclobacteriaceae bacterium]|nr:hypothetical protein [Cyclobacteriaceae bacterium]
MPQNRLSYSEAKKIPITDYLSSLGFGPVKIRGIDQWYHSPFRDERTPSFKVNTRLNVWYDHGTGDGGTILDLGAKLHGCSLQEFLEKLSTDNYQLPVCFHQPKVPLEKPENRLEIISPRELTSGDLLYYLRSRSIDAGIAKQYCKEIEFRIGPKIYTAIGFPNNSGAFELRNNWFKGSSSPKDISFINNNSEKVSVLEGFMDFLSVIQIEHREINQITKISNFLVLNSLRLLTRSLPILQSHKEINLFLDNDSAAHEAKESLKERGIDFRDASALYREHKDVNEYLIATSKIKHDQTLPRTRSKGVRR